MFNLLTMPLITAADRRGRNPVRLTLPEALTALVRGDIGDFPRIRPHQRHVWHAFLVQIAVIALAMAERSELPDHEAQWAILLAAAAPDDPDGAAWSLVTAPDRPALLQAAIPGSDLASLKKRVETPDALDMLVNGRNHDLKSGTVPRDDPELWLYALVSLQTQEGFLGSGNYGIARMNGGFANRPCVALVAPGLAGGHFRRDVSRLLEMRTDIIDQYGYRNKGGVALTWLEPWDGATSLPLAKLDPYFIEICRRVRLVSDAGGMTALASGSKATRIEAKAIKGKTGDPWTPLKQDKDGGYKALTADASGWTYKNLVPLLFPIEGKVVQAPLHHFSAADRDSGYAILARALIRGQGKTEGYHERRIPISAALKTRMFGPREVLEPAAKMAHQRLIDVGTFSSEVLLHPVLAALTGAPNRNPDKRAADSGANERARDDDVSRGRANRFVQDFERRVDVTFFDYLDAELRLLDNGNAEKAKQERARWLRDHLRPVGRLVLGNAIDAAPGNGVRGWRVRVKAVGLFESLFRKAFGEIVALIETDDASVSERRVALP